VASIKARMRGYVISIVLIFGVDVSNASTESLSSLGPVFREFHDLEFSQSFLPTQVEAFFGVPDTTGPQEVLSFPPSEKVLSDESYNHQDAWARIRLPAESANKDRVIRVLPALFARVEFYLFDS